MSGKADWTRVAFGDVVRLVRERSSDPEGDEVERYVGLEHIDPGDLRIRRWGNISDGTTFTNVFRSGQVLFGKRRAYQRKVAVADFDGVCSGDIYVFESKSGHFLPELLPFICQTDRFFEHAVGTSAGSLSPRTNWNSLAAFEFSLPPIEEQRRIARALKASDEHRQRIRELHATIEALLASMRKQYFISEPEGDLKEIGEVAAVRNGTTPSRGDLSYWAGDIPWLPTGKVNERRICSADEFITQKALRECSLSVIPRGATLVAMVGEGQTRGRVALLELEACINQNFGAVIPGENIDPNFLFFQLESQYEGLRHWSQGTNQHALNCRLISAYRVRVPPVRRQREIAAQFEHIDSALRAAAVRLESARAFHSDTARALIGREGA